jgi:hypothetical protein
LHEIAREVLARVSLLPRRKEANVPHQDAADDRIIAHRDRLTAAQTSVV